MSVKGRRICKRPVVSLSEAADIGKLENIVFDRQAHVAAFVLRRRSNNNELAATDISNVHAVGPDVITLEKTAAVEGGEKVEALSDLPNLRQLIGCRVITESGSFLGTVRDVLLDTERQVITDFELVGRGVLGRLRGDLIPATGKMRFGQEIVIVPAVLALKGKAALERIAEPSPPVMVEIVAQVELPKTAEQPATKAEAVRHGEEGLTRAVGG